MSNPFVDVIALRLAIFFRESEAVLGRQPQSSTVRN